MSRRRGFGNVRKLPSGRWQARYWLPGGGHLAAPGTFTTKAEANRWLATVEADRARGLWVDPRAGRIKLEEYAATWLDSKVGISPRTREIYALQLQLQLRLHVLPAVSDDIPALGSVPIADITPELVRAWYLGLAAERGTSVAAKAYARLRQVLAQAVDDDRIAKNACRIKKGAAERHPEQRFASLAELYELAVAVPERFRALVLTAGLAGLRQGELLALRRRDVDVLRSSIAVRRKRLRLATGLVIEDDPKSAAGRRRVALPAPPGGRAGAAPPHVRRPLGRRLRLRFRSGFKSRLDRSVGVGRQGSHRVLAG